MIVWRLFWLIWGHSVLGYFLMRRTFVIPPAPNFPYPSTEWPQISQKSRQTIKISWEMSSDCEFFSLKHNYYNFVWAFEYICARSYGFNNEGLGKFSPFSFNKFGLKSYQVEFVDFEYRLNEGKSIKSSSPTKILPNLLTAAQQEIYILKRLRDIDIIFMRQPEV